METERCPIIVNVTVNTLGFFGLLCFYNSAMILPGVMFVGGAGFVALFICLMSAVGSCVCFVMMNRRSRFAWPVTFVFACVELALAGYVINETFLESRDFLDFIFPGAVAVLFASMLCAMLTRQFRMWFKE